MQKVIAIRGGIARLPEWQMACPVYFELLAGENVAIVGPNGGGKSMFVSMLTGSHPLFGDEPQYDFSPSTKELVSDNIKYIQFTDSYGENDSAYYLQQRWNQQEIDETTPTVNDILEKAYCLTGNDSDARRQWQTHLYDLFSIGHTLDKYIILLSSGELRKVQIIKALLSMPRVLIIDNPFIGLDVDTRLQLKELLGLLCEERALQIMLVLAKTDDIPAFITHVVTVKDMIVGNKMPLDEYLVDYNGAGEECAKRVADSIAGLPGKVGGFLADEVISMKDVSIKYGKRVILDKLNWTVRNGERWAVTGKNGSGKSTLLSLVCADNPQSYACDIALFGKQRGTGESIWEIKRHIGYVSPEMHRAYKKNIPALNIVASGLKESVGLYLKPNASEIEISRWWMDLFGLAGLENRPFLQLSSGEQRLVLLARAFVKDPELLVLDEPLHGLDDRNRQMVKCIIEEFCSRPNKTLIMVTHYAEELPAGIDHTLVLKRNV